MLEVCPKADNKQEDFVGHEVQLSQVTPSQIYQLYKNYKKEQTSTLSEQSEPP